MKDWAEITKTRRLDMLERVVSPQSVSSQSERALHTISLKLFRKLLNEEHRQLPLKPVATLRADSDPVWPVRKALPANKTQHKQALNPQQIGKLLSCFDNSRGSYQVNYCMWLMWWTLARPAEATEAEWTEFDLDSAMWIIPAA